MLIHGKSSYLTWSTIEEAPLGLDAKCCIADSSHGTTRNSLAICGAHLVT